MTIQEKLDQLASLQDLAAKIRETFEETKAFYLAPVKENIDLAEQNMLSKMAELNPIILELTEEIKTLVTDTGQSVKGKYLHAVFVKGRISWDGKLLDGFAMAHPVILQARSEGKPSVTLRQIKPTQEG